MHLKNITAGKRLFLRHRFNVFMGALYMVSSIGYEKPKRDWLKYCMSTWEKNIIAITKLAGIYIPSRFTPRWFV